MALNNATGEGRNWTLILGIGAALVPLMYFSMPTIIVFAAGMLPSGVAWLCDRTDQKYATFCVGGLNLCGVFPYVMKVWADGLEIAGAIDIISNIFSLLIMYSAAGFGWMMFLAIPPVVSAFLTVLAERRVMFLRSLQDDIVQEWGPEVSMMEEPSGTTTTPAPAG